MRIRVSEHNQQKNDRQKNTDIRASGEGGQNKTEIDRPPAGGLGTSG